MWFFDHLPGPSYTISYRFIYIHLANKCWNVSAQGPLFFSVWSLFLGGLIHICSFNYHLFGKDSDAGMDWGQEEKGMTEDEMAELHHWIDGREFEWTPGIGDGQGGLACCNSWGRRESDTTEWLNWTELYVPMDMSSELLRCLPSCQRPKSWPIGPNVLPVYFLLLLKAIHSHSSPSSPKFKPYHVCGLYFLNSGLLW